MKQNANDDARRQLGHTVPCRRTAMTRLGLVVVLLAIAACSSVDRSRQLADPGTPATTIALQVCANCHGAQGVSTSPNFPILAAQSATYLTEQLKSFRSHGRSDPPDMNTCGESAPI